MTEREQFDLWWGTKCVSPSCEEDDAWAGWQARSASQPVQKTHDDSWEETARQYAENAKYWREKYESSQPAQPTALEQYQLLKVDQGETDPVERLRAFCSFAMRGQDWLDVEQFFDALSQQQAEPVACVSKEYGLEWLKGPFPSGTKFYAAPPADDDGKMQRELQHYKNCLGIAADQVNEAVRLLKHLYATVKGECPSLLDEDRGGNGWLDLEIDAYLAKVNK